MGKAPHRGGRRQCRERRPRQDRQRQGETGKIAFAGQIGPDTAGDQYPQAGSGSDEVGHERGGGDDLLEVVEHQEQAPGPSPPREPRRQRFVPVLVDPDRLGDRRRHARRIGDRCQRHEDTSIGVGRRDLVGHLQREACLADATRSGQGDEPHDWIAQERNQFLDLSLPPDERRQRFRQTS